MGNNVKQTIGMPAIKQFCQQALSIGLIGLLFSSLVPYNFILLCWIAVSSFFSESWFQKVDDFIWGWYQRLVVFVYEHYSGVEVLIDGNIPVIKENSIVLSNHQSALDWIIANFIAVRQNATGHVRYVLKNSLKYYPLCGLPFTTHSDVFVKRDGSHNDRKLRETMEKLIRRKASVFLMIYPEGTRFNPRRKDVLQKSQDYAIKLGLKQLNHVLTPRVKAFDSALESLRDYVDAVYDITVIYDDRERRNTSERGGPLGTLEFLNGACKRVYIKFRRISIDDVLENIACYDEKKSNDASASMNWLHERLALKDELLTDFYSSAPSQDSPEQNENSGKKDNWKLSSSPLSATLPAFLLAAIFHCALYFPVVRYCYFFTVTVGTALGLIYCHFCV